MKNESAIEKITEVYDRRKKIIAAALAAGEKRISQVKDLVRRLETLTQTGYARVKNDEVESYREFGILKALRVAIDPIDPHGKDAVVITFRFNYKPSTDTRPNKEKIKSGGSDKVEAAIEKSGLGGVAEYRYMGYFGGQITVRLFPGV